MGSLQEYLLCRVNTGHTCAGTRHTATCLHLQLQPRYIKVNADSAKCQRPNTKMVESSMDYAHTGRVIKWYHSTATLMES